MTENNNEPLPEPWAPAPPVDLAPETAAPAVNAAPLDEAFQPGPAPGALAPDPTGIQPAPDGFAAPAAAQPPVAAATAVKDRSAHEVKDGFREIVETIVFVVVLVLLLKGFEAEAFVIPTGSMATTLLGYHREVECPDCRFRFRINMSSELDPDLRPDQRRPVTGCTCPNCFLGFHLPGTRPPDVQE